MVSIWDTSTLDLYLFFPVLSYYNHELLEEILLHTEGRYCIHNCRLKNKQPTCTWVDTDVINYY